jgi:hypothetical protein
MPTIMAPAGTSIDSWELVMRVADSPMFQRAGRLRELLLYICQRSMQGRFDELREQRIGIDVFARGPDFRPNEDNIVRVEARQLRKRLEDYFATEGKAEPIIISIPKGAYVAAFERRVAIAPDSNPAEATVPPPVEAETFAEGRPRPANFPWAAFFLGTTILSLALMAWLVLSGRETMKTPDTPKSGSFVKPLWGELFDKDHQTYIVCSDSALVLVQELTDRSVTLAEYANRKYSPDSQLLAPEVETLLRILPQRQYTNVSDVRLVQEILQLNNEDRGRSVVRSARNMQLIDFKNGNFVLLGSKRSTPWVELFEPSLNFHFVYDGKSKRTGFSDDNPNPGEKSVYWTEGSPTQLDETYGVIAFLPNPSHNGNVLIIQGATGEGTEAAGEYVTNPELLRRLLRSIHAMDNDRVRYFEVLLKSGTIAGTPRDAEVIAYHFIRDTK